MAQAAALKAAAEFSKSVGMDESLHEAGCAIRTLDKHA
ncbi:hypothetical protein ACPOL_5535 [Acidisarcina polymorpha]|uniref:Uncharacterized protein n=1 Tax=Acidisarcina polymorpha TaxID=2211140 RepID=A0A2Z5G6A2_9BACT|nr:hypothetical protein ACPOL_5535 [Acidisarcina polymorpha]